MNQPIRQFHLAIAATDLEASRHFYVNILGARQGRTTYNHVDLDFYGHHLVIHQTPRDTNPSASFDSDFHGENVPVPHLGMNLSHQEWSTLAERIKAHGYKFSDPPHIRMLGEPGEHATMFLLDPTGNALEFKAFRDHAEVFAETFKSPREPAVLGALVDAAQVGS